MLYTFELSLILCLVFYKTLLGLLAVFPGVVLPTTNWRCFWHYLSLSLAVLGRFLLYLLGTLFCELHGSVIWFLSLILKISHSLFLKIYFQLGSVLFFLFQFMYTSFDTCTHTSLTFCLLLSLCSLCFSAWDVFYWSVFRIIDVFLSHVSTDKLINNILNSAPVPLFSSRSSLFGC